MTRARRGATERSQVAKPLLRLLGMLLLPRLESRVVMETWEDPPEKAQAWLPTPTIRVAVACQEPGGLPRSADHGKDGYPIPNDSKIRLPHAN